jgi:hypothetical protein
LTTETVCSERDKQNSSMIEAKQNHCTTSMVHGVHIVADGDINSAFPKVDERPTASGNGVDKRRISHESVLTCCEHFVAQAFASRAHRVTGVHNDRR